MAKYKFERPERPEDKCLHSGPQGECPFKRIEGSKFCPRHGAHHVFNAAAKADSRLYMVAKWQERIGTKVDNPKSKTLGEEVGIIRMLIEERLLQCKDESDLLMASHSITQMLTTAEKLVASHHKIEKERALLLDPDRALKLATDIVGVIATYLDDPDILKAVTDDITGLFGNLNT